MNKFYFALALAVMCILGFGESSRAQEADAIVVTVPFDFVVGTQTMPAGRYDVGRLLSNDQRSSLILRGDGRSAIVLPTGVEETSTFQANLTFQHLGDKYFLNKIKTPAGIYTIPAPRPMPVVARTTDKNALPAGGTN
jgi:hypothetical protein